MLWEGEVSASLAGSISPSAGRRHRSQNFNTPAGNRSCRPPSEGALILSRGNSPTGHFDAGAGATVDGAEVRGTEEEFARASREPSGVSGPDSRR